MFNPKKRGFLVKAAAVLAAVALTVGASPSHAQPRTVIDMPESANVTITKLDQPAAVGNAAVGTPQDTTDLTPIEGVTFEAYEVPLPGVTKGTEAWQQEIAATTLAQAQSAIGATPAHVVQGTTNTNGVITWSDMEWGLYLVRETATPPSTPDGTGIVASPDFLLAVPLTNPADLNAWLTDIYVYPKNSVVKGTKTVENQESLVTGPNVGIDDNGDPIATTPVTWTINADIPKIGGPANTFVATDRFEIRDTLTNSELSLVNGVNSVTVTAPTGLSASNYGITLDTTTEGETTVVITFTSEGRTALANALNDGQQQVTVTIDTIVNTLGPITNDATVYPSVRTDSEYDITPAEVRYGNITLQKLSTQGDSANLEGAEFRVYSNFTAAQNKTDAYLTTASKTDGLWTTDADGKIEISGLRYSNFADGAPLALDAQQSYWLVETKALADHQLLAEPIEFTVTSADGSNVVSVTNSANTNGFTLPLTGGTGTALLTFLGIALLGVVLFVARTRRNSEAA